MRNASPTAALPVELLLTAYRNGLFPMAHEDGELYWHQPDPRAIFDLPSLRPDDRTQRVMRSRRYATSLDQDFEGVIRACADRDESWIDERIIMSYLALHRAGHAHSVEVWEQEQLVGGIYGVALGAAFFGESMYGRDNAGKVAFFTLAEHVRCKGFSLFDTQYINPFTRRLGAFEIPKTQFEKLLALAVDRPVHF